ncbi:pyrroline-5-carboxylate reductase [Candidatus Bathyarchaeota archaeon]|nr:pyrroline-5-carboxylate reductase [Candidatus Bathyarchaeota archaeon]MBS7631111.1 pyrroline-5-carboxylate reductase [Candidatus Bathyarchaeota archaeon]
MVKVVSIIGAGVIGGAIARCLARSNIVEKVVATRRKIEKLEILKTEGIELSEDNLHAAEIADVIFICVKPGDVEKVLKQITHKISGKLIISTAAIIPLNFYHSISPKSKFVRTMPNVAALVGESFTAYCCDENVTREDKEIVKKLLRTLGSCEEVEEKHMDAITGLSGSGPAYIAHMIEALMYAGLKVGLPRDLAMYSAAQAVLGTAKMILKGGFSPSAIKEMVTTPGGTTIEGIYQLEDGKIATALIKAVEAATSKCANIRYSWNNK